MDRTFRLFTVAGGVVLMLFAVSTTASAGQGSSHSQAQEAQRLPLQSKDVQAAIAKYKQEDPEISHFFDNAYAYAVFPGVGKGDGVIGSGYGGGEVFRNGKLVGRATVTGFKIPLRVGGETFSEVIFFDSAKALDRFTQGGFQLPVSAATGVKSAAAAHADYSNGMAIFTTAKGGLKKAVGLGGQQFSYTPLTH